MVNSHKIRTLREKENLSAIEFAEKVMSSQAMISFIETGVKQPSVALLKRIADYFGCKVDDLIVDIR